MAKYFILVCENLYVSLDACKSVIQYIALLGVRDEVLINGILCVFVHTHWFCLQNPSRGVTRAEGHVFVDVFQSAARPALLSLSCEAGRT